MNNTAILYAAFVLEMQWDKREITERKLWATNRVAGANGTTHYTAHVGMCFIVKLHITFETILKLPET